MACAETCGAWIEQPYIAPARVSAPPMTSFFMAVDRSVDALSNGGGLDLIRSPKMMVS